MPDNPSTDNPNTDTPSTDNTGTNTQDTQTPSASPDESSSAPSNPGYEYVDTSIEDDIDNNAEFEELYGHQVTYESYSDLVDDLRDNSNVYQANGKKSSSNYAKKITDNITGIFGIPYQFSSDVDPIMEENPNSANDTDIHVGRKYSQKILSVMPILFLTPGEPMFMGKGHGKGDMALGLAQKLYNALNHEDDNDSNNDIDKDGRYYTFAQNFPEYKKYANTALRALAFYMGIQDISVPIPGTNEDEQLCKLDIEHFMSTDFTKIFGSNCVVPFYLDAETSISEDFSNDTAESMIAQTANGFSQTAREIQFILGTKDGGGLMKAMGSAVTELGTNLADAAGQLSDALVGKNLLSRITGELTTIVSGGKIIFPEIWSGSSYSKSYNINLKLRSPDPDPVSIFLNVYMPLVLLVSMASPRQIGNGANSYEAPFLVRATYKSIFNCDLGIIQSLSITKGGPDRWNVMGQPYTADVTITLKDLYSDMFISKMMGLICNTAEMDYLATMAGVNLNDYEFTRLAKMAAMILRDAPRDYVNDFWGGVKRSLAQKAAGLLGNFSDVRSLGW